MKYTKQSIKYAKKVWKIIICFKTFFLNQMKTYAKNLQISNKKNMQKIPKKSIQENQKYSKRMHEYAGGGGGGIAQKMQSKKCKKVCRKVNPYLKKN